MRGDLFITYSKYNKYIIPSIYTSDDDIVVLVGDTLIPIKSQVKHKPICNVKLPELAHNDIIYNILKNYKQYIRDNKIKELI